MEQFVLQFDTDLAPIVGQQVTLDGTPAPPVGTGNASVANPRIDTLLLRAAANFTSQILGGVVKECDVIVKGTVGGVARGWVRNSGGTFTPDKTTDATLSDASLRALAAVAGQQLTYTAVPPGSGTRMGIDQDEDGVRDRDDNCPSVANAG